MTNLVKSNILPDESPERRELERAIVEREKILVAVLGEVEQLRVDLSILKQEYDIKIGRLYLRLDEVELEILKFRKVEDLLTQGFSLTEAQKIIEETLKKRREQIDEERRKLNEENKDFEGHKILSADEQTELKKLWRKLAHRYHPDFAHGNDEMMKKINKAYTEGDVEILRAIDRNQSVPDAEVSSIENLKAKLVTLKKSIQKASGELEIMQKSEWTVLKRNIEVATKQKRDLLNELSEKVLSTIVKKENQLDELKKKYEQG